MLQYPPIVGSKDAPLGKKCIAFNKYDGSNLRWEWNPKRGWVKYGTRRQLFDANTPLYNQAIEPFLDLVGPAVVDATKHFCGRKPERITAFTEFFGKSSFAGSHEFDEPKELRLFDVFVFKQGFIPPRPFAKLFSHQDWAAEVIYEGNLNTQFIQDVREGKYPVYEGVICKGDDFMVKIKTNEFLDRLKKVYIDEWTNYAE